MTVTWTLTGRLNQGGQPRSIPMQSLPFRVGRRTELSLSLPRPSVSSLHAEFFAEGESLFLRDLQSTNGTYVNGDRVEGAIEVHHDDLIQFADMPFRLGHRSDEFDSRTVQEDVCDRALGLVQFDKLISERALLAYFQPLVQLSDNQTVAYEILSRSRLVGLDTPRGNVPCRGSIEHGNRTEPSDARRGHSRQRPICRAAACVRQHAPRRIGRRGAALGRSRLSDSLPARSRLRSRFTKPRWPTFRH